MAIKNIVARGVGFTPGAARFIVTHGFGAGAAVVVTIVQPTGGWEDYAFLNRPRRDVKAERKRLLRKTPEDIAEETRRIGLLAAEQAAAEIAGEARRAKLQRINVEADAMLRAALERIGAEYRADYLRLVQLEIILALARRDEEEAIVMLLLDL